MNRIFIKTVLLETPYVKDYAALANEIDKLVNAEILKQGLILLAMNFGHAKPMLAEHNCEGIWTILLTFQVPEKNVGQTS